jgi:hypothetical protein
MRKNRSLWLLLLLATVPCANLRGQGLQARLEGSILYAKAPEVRFLTDRVVARLHNGASVSFHFQLVAVPGSGGRPVAEASDLFVLSFDLWEEKFAVVQSAAPRRSVSHLSANAAEAWCLDNLPLPVQALAPESPFVLRLEIRAEDPEEEAAGDAASGLSLAGLIDVFSRKSKEPPLRWTVVSGPIRLAGLKNGERGGSRSPEKAAPQKGGDRFRMSRFGQWGREIARGQAAR